MSIKPTYNSFKLSHEIIESLLQDAYGVEFLKIDGQLVFDVHAASGGVTLNRCMYLLKPLDQGFDKPRYAVTSGVEFGRFYEYSGPYWGRIFERLAISICELHKELVDRDGLVTQQRIDQQIALINLDNSLQPRVTDLDGGYTGKAVSLSTLEAQPAEYTSKIDLSLIP